MNTLTFLHTSPVHIATFDHLLAELAPAVPVKHVVDTILLRDARARGVTTDLAQRVRQTIATAITDGAALVVCTCSTIGGCAEAAQEAIGRPVLRIDRAMAEQAIAHGSRILIAATLGSTLDPTRNLLRDVAQQAQKPVTLIDLLCDNAWALFERGDDDAYLTTIATCLQQAAPAGDVIVLAQASMADAIRLCPELPIPVLSSPRLGLEAALRIYWASA